MFIVLASWVIVVLTPITGEPLAPPVPKSLPDQVDKESVALDGAAEVKGNPPIVKVDVPTDASVLKVTRQLTYTIRPIFV